MRVNIQQRIAKQLQELETEFRKGHKSYVAKIKGQAIEEYRPDLSLSSKPTGAGGASSFFEEPDEAASDPRFNAQQTLQLVMMDQMSAEREKQINQVAESVNDLADIFKEIQVLVIDQGTVLDRIDYNIEQAASKVNRSPGSNPRASRGCAHDVSPPLHGVANVPTQVTFGERACAPLAASAVWAPNRRVADWRRRGGVAQGERLPEEVEDDAVHLPAADPVRTDGHRAASQKVAQQPMRGREHGQPLRQYY